MININLIIIWIISYVIISLSPKLYNLLTKKLYNTKSNLIKKTIEYSNECSDEINKSIAAIFDSKFKSTDITVYYVKNDRFYFGNDDKLLDIENDIDLVNLINKAKYVWINNK